MRDITDFVTEGPVPTETIEAYRDRVPDELIELWQRYGYGTWGEGFLRVIDPEQYEQALADCLGKVTGEGIAIPIMVTGLADLITWEPGEGVHAILYRNGRMRGLGRQLKTLVNLVALDGAEELHDTFGWDPFPAAVAKHGAPAFGESFVFVPLLSLGGSLDVDSMRKRDTITAIQVMVELQGVIEH